MSIGNGVGGVISSILIFLHIQGVLQKILCFFSLIQSNLENGSLEIFFLLFSDVDGGRGKGETQPAVEVL